MIFLVLLLYLVMVGFGALCIWISFQIAARKRYDFVRNSHNKPLPRAELIATRFATMAGAIGVAALVFCVAVPILGIPWLTWHYYFGVIVAVAALWRDVLVMRHTKLSASSAPNKGSGLPPSI